MYNNTYKGGVIVSPKPIENTERVSTYITSEQLRALRMNAKDKGMTVSGYIRLLIIESLTQK